MKTSKQLREERASIVKKLEGLVDSAKAENRDFTPEEDAKVTALRGSLEALSGKIANAEMIEKEERNAAAAAGIAVGGGEAAEKKKMLSRYSLHKALRSQLPNAAPLDGVEAEYDQEMRSKAGAAGVSISGVAVPNGASVQERAAGQTVTQDSGAFGANLVGQDQFGIIEQLRPSPVVESLGARYMRGLKGDAVFPTNDGGIVATWEGEISAVNPTKNAYGKKTMSPKRLSATALISLQNLYQSTPDLEALTAADIRLATQEAIDLAAINGAGTGNVPKGILNEAGINLVVAGDPDGAAPSWAKIVEMETAVYSANAEAASMAYLVSPKLKGLLKTTKHQAGDANYLMSMANEINGYKVGVSTLVPNDLDKGGSTDILSAAIFGDFSQLLIGEWGFYDMVVDYITGKKEGNIELTVNQFVDILVRQPKAFSAVKDFITG